MLKLSSLLLQTEFGTHIIIKSFSKGYIYDGDIRNMRNSTQDILKILNLINANDEVSRISIEDNALIIKTD